jgi:hypothetical protein
MENFKIEKLIKSITKTIAATIIVAIAIRFITVYLTSEVDIITLTAGLLGMLILYPTIKHYIRLLDILFPGHREYPNQTNTPKTTSDSLDKVDKIRKTLQKK